jgi:transcriptional regulator with XRE-family HTH domain
MTAMTAVSGWTLQGTPDPVRAYLRDLRIGRGLTHQALADEIGMSRRSLIGWEMGDTEEMKQSALLRAITVLQVPREHLERLTDPDADVALGKALALEALTATMDAERLARAKRAIQRQRARIR